MKMVFRSTARGREEEGSSKEGVGRREKTASRRLESRLKVEGAER